MTGFSLTLLGSVLTLLPTDKNLLAQEDCVSEVFLKSRCWPAWKQPMVSESRRSSANYKADQAPSIVSKREEDSALPFGVTDTHYYIGKCCESGV